MKKRTVSGCLGVLIAASMVPATGHAGSRQAPQVQIPNPGVPQAMTLQGKFVRVAGP